MHVRKGRVRPTGLGLAQAGSNIVEELIDIDPC